MAFVVGEVSAPVTADATQFNTTMRNVKSVGEQAVKGISSQFNKITQQLTTFGMGMSKYVTLPLGGAGAAAFKLGADFETSLSQVVGLVGVAREQVDAWGQDLLEMAPKLGRAPKELAEALYFVTSAGIKGAEAMDVVEMSGKAAAAGLGETRIIADLVTSAINAYGKANLTAAQATDILVATVREGKAEAPALAASLGAVLPIASAMGVTFEQVGAAVAAMTRTGTAAETAAMELKNILASLLKPTGQAKEALSMMGLSAEGLRKQIKEEGLLSALMTIREATNRYGEDVMAKVFPNIRALMGVLDMMGSNLEDNIAIFESLENSSGMLAGAFGAAGETAQFKLNQVLSQSKVLLTDVGKTVIANAVPALQWLKDALKGVHDWWNRLDPAAKNFIVRLGMMAVAIGPFTLGLVAAKTVVGLLVGNLGGFATSLLGLKPLLKDVNLAFGLWRAGAGTLKEALMACVSPLGLLTAGIGLAIAGVATLIIRENARIKASIEERADAIQDAMVREATAARDAAQAQINAEREALNVNTSALQQRIANLETEKAARREALQKRLDGIGEERDKAIQAIRDEYGYVERASNSKTDLARRASQEVIDALDREAEVAKDHFNERMRQLNEEYAAKLKLVDDETASAIAAIQEQIDAIDRQTSEEDKARHRAQMKKRIAEESDSGRRKELVDELARWEELQARDAQKAALRLQIETLQDEARDRKDALADELKEKQETETLKHEAVLSRIEDDKAIEETALAEAIERIQTEREAKEAAEKAKYAALEISLKNQLEGLDEYYKGVQVQLEADLQNFIAAEDAKTAELRRALEERQAELTEHYAWLDSEEEQREKALEKAREEYDAMMESRAAMGKWLTEQGTLEGDIAPSIFPGFARGAVINAGPGGMIARIGEVPEAVTPLSWLGEQFQKMIDSVTSAISGAGSNGSSSPAFAGGGGVRDVSLTLYQVVPDKATADHSANAISRVLRNLGVE